MRTGVEVIASFNFSKAAIANSMHTNFFSLTKQSMA